MHFLQMPFSLCPVLLAKEAGSMSKIEEIFLSIKLINGYEVIIEDSGQNVHGILFVRLNGTNPIEDHSRGRQALHGVKSAKSVIVSRHG